MYIIMYIQNISQMYISYIVMYIIMYIDDIL